MARDVIRPGGNGLFSRLIVGVLLCFAAVFGGFVWLILLHSESATTSIPSKTHSSQANRTFQIDDGKFWVDLDGAVDGARNAVLSLIPSADSQAASPSPWLIPLPKPTLVIPKAIGPILIADDDAVNVARRALLELIPPPDSDRRTSTTSGLPTLNLSVLADALPQGLRTISIRGTAVAGYPDISSAVMSPSEAAGLVPISFFLSEHTSSGNVVEKVKALNDAVRAEQARKFVMSECIDLQGNLWVGTEDVGIERFRPDADRSGRGQWTQFTTKDGLGDDNGYALACDHRGRIWVGHLNHGVSVYDGQKWQNYEVVGGVLHPDSLSGPLGERVFHIAVCPTDGDVWMATSAGITRYRDSQDTWTYYTRADGLPSDQANSIAFDRDGNVYVATQCEGMAMAEAGDDYRSWRQLTGPDMPPPEPHGTGLPTNLINDVMVAGDGTVYAATTTGLAWSSDSGRTWSFVRGTDWADKVRQSTDGPPKGWTEQPGASLAEDYTTCLWEDNAGHLYMGHRQHGCESFICKSGRVITQSLWDGAYVNAGTTLSDGQITIGTFGDGLVIVGETTKESSTPLASSTIASLPSGARPPDLASLNRELLAMGEVPPLRRKADPPTVIPLDDDWLTEGDWLGRYGRFWCVLAAMDDPIRGYFWGAGPEKVPFEVSLGSHHRSDDFLRYWIGLFFTDNRRALEIPTVYMHTQVLQKLATWNENRRMAEWDDHGETYPYSFDGPDIDIRLGVPDGCFFMSLYEINKDGHFGADNSYRDFMLSIKDNRTGDLFGQPQFNAQPELSSGRVMNFCNGVYKRFLVQGPCDLAIRIRRNHSYCCGINALMLDLPDERPVGYFMSAEQWEKTKAEAAAKRTLQMADWDAGKRESVGDFAPRASEREAAEALSNNLRTILQWNPRWWAFNNKRLAVVASRWYKIHGTVANHPSFAESGDLDFAGLLQAWEERQFEMHFTTARQIEKSLPSSHDALDGSGKGYSTIREYLAAIHAEDGESQ